MHSIACHKEIFTAADGLMLGNGRFSVSCYQRPGQIIFQTGHNEFWDTRLHLEENPRPAHIDELIEAIRKHGLKVDGVTGKLDSAEMTQRLTEITHAMPSQRYAAPMPKPGPEVILHYPADWSDFTITQKLEIERGLLTIELRHFDGAALTIHAVIHPESDRLSINWDLQNWSSENVYGGFFFGLPDLPPVFLTLRQENEVALSDFRSREFRQHGNTFYAGSQAPGETLCSVVENNVLVRNIPEGPTLYAAVAQTTSGRSSSEGDVLRLFPDRENTQGQFFAALSITSADEAGSLADSGDFEADRNAAATAAECFWSKSQVHFPSPVYEEAWYAAMHAKRCVLKRGVVPPGLFFPSTLQDYSLWKGDYHLNYNYQSIFLGDWECNHPETGDAFFDGLEELMKLGEKISRDYYGIDGGCFIQLCGYPVAAADDYFGYLPLGRMAYMTGWAAAWFYRRWRLFKERDFLEKRAYPALKKFAVFYAGFLKPDAEGVWHAFPSNQGENDFSREGATDKPQVLYNACFALLAAADCAKELDLDAEEAEKWRLIAHALPGCGKLIEKGIAPEFFNFDGEELTGTPDFLQPGNRFHDWYFGQMPYKASVMLRSGNWQKEFFVPVEHFLRRWRQPNGLMRAMSIATHGFRPCWTESIGVAGALTDMLITGDNNLITLFPGIPDSESAGFSSLRTDGAFLVSAQKNHLGVTQISVTSECGGLCRIKNPWPEALVQSTAAADVISAPVIEVETLPGQQLRLTPVK